MDLRPDLTALRVEIDGVDKTIASLLEKREELARQVALAKGPGPIFRGAREAEILSRSARPAVTEAILRASKEAQAATSRPPEGGAPFAIVAGPCSAETEQQVEEVAAALARFGIRRMRAGAWKPRTSPRGFQGNGVDALRWMRASADRHGLEVWSELRDLANLAHADLIDVAWIGARNCQNFELLRAVGERCRRVVLKRGAGCTVDEWLAAAEYIDAGGCAEVSLCERGIRTFDGAFRNTLDLAGAAWAKRLSGRKVYIDPSHATGIPTLIAPMVAAARAAGLDGAIIEAHPRPRESWTDAVQALSLVELESIARTISA